MVDGTAGYTVGGIAYGTAVADGFREAEQHDKTCDLGGWRVTSSRPDPLLKVGAASGALLVAATLVGAPASARADVACRDNDGWWCLYGKPDLQDGGALIGTNNGDTDLKMDGDWSFFNDGTRSAINRSGSYVGLYNDIEFKDLMACLPPRTRLMQIRAGVSSLRIHPSRSAACIGPRAAKPEPLDPKPTPKTSPEDTGGAAVTPSRKPKAQKPDPAASVSPTLDLPQVDDPAPQLPSAPPVNAGATKAPADQGGVAWGAVAAVSAAAVAALLLLAGLGVGGWMFGRRRRAAL